MNEQDQILVLRDNAKAELMQIKTVEDGLSYLNKVKSIETWVKAEKKDGELQNIIAEQKLRTQRVLGELIKEGQERGEIKTSTTAKVEDIKSISDIGLSHNQSSTFKQIADIPEPEFESFIADKKANVENAVNELTTKGAVELSKKLRTPITDIKKTTELNIRLQAEAELLRLVSEINKNYNKPERKFIKERINV